jgi:hypothetical protein
MQLFGDESASLPRGSLPELSRNYGPSSGTGSGVPDGRNGGFPTVTFALAA